MSRTTLSLAIVATLAAGASVPAAPAERPLTLREAIELALANNESILIRRESVAATESARTGAAGAYDPFLELQSGWRRASLPVNSAFAGAPEPESAPTTEATEAGGSVTQRLPTGGQVRVQARAYRESTDGTFELLSPSYGTSVGVELRQPLLRDRAIDAARFTIRVAAIERERAGASLRRELTETVAAVEQAYWSLVAVHREVAVREEAVRLAAEQLEETGIRIENGAAPDTEIAQPRSELERRRGELLSSREALARAQNDLKLLILGDTDTALWSDTLVAADDPDAATGSVDVAAMMDSALSGRPELEEARAVSQRRRAEVALARDAVRPALDAVVSYERFGLAGRLNVAGTTLSGGPIVIPDGMEGGFGTSFSLLGENRFDEIRAGVVFSVPIGNRAAQSVAAIARSIEVQADAELTLARKRVRAEVLDAAAALETAAQRIEAARAAREAAEVQLSAEQDRYGAGLSTNFLVLTRQNDLSRSRLEEIAALTDHRRARTEIARVTATLLSERGVLVEAER